MNESNKHSVEHLFSLQENDIINTRELLELKTLLNYTNIPLEEALKDLEMKANEKILSEHRFKIYYSESEKAWRTYLPDSTKSGGRKPLKRATRENLEKEIVKFYKAEIKKADVSQTTLEQLYKQWLIFRRDETSASAKTIQENTYEWKKFFQDTTLSKMPVAEIKPLTLVQFFRKITKTKEHTYKRISNARSVLNGVMAYGIEKGIIEHNPVLDVNFKQFSYKPVENQSDNVFSKEEAVKLLTYLQDINEPYALAISLSFYLFIRVGETKAIRWEDIDYENRTVYLHGQVLTERELNDDLTFSARQVHLADHIKGNTSKGFRKEYLTDEALKILQKAKELNPDGEFVFMPDNRVMTTDSFNRRLKKYCKESGISYHSSHKIRFYTASTAYNGNNLATVSKLMGHSQLSTTLHYLRDVNKDDDISSAFQNLGLSANL